MRHLGVSGKCCPKGYYEGTREEMKAANEDVTALFNATTDEVLRARYEAGKFPKPKIPRRSAGCDGSIYDDENVDTRMANEGFQINDFLKYIYFAHCDFRSEREYTRNPKAFFQVNGRRYDKYRHQLLVSETESNAKKAEENQVESEFNKTLPTNNTDEVVEAGGLRSSRRSVSKIVTQVTTKKKKVFKPHKVLTPAEIEDKVDGLMVSRDIGGVYCRGVKGRNAFDRLKYEDRLSGAENNAQPDPFHVLKNFGEAVIDVIKIKPKHKSIKLCLAEGRFGYWAKYRLGEALPEETDKPEASSSSANSAKVTTGKESAVRAKRKVEYTNIGQDDYSSDVVSHRNHIPWLLRDAEQKMVDWRHNCILIPLGQYSFTFKFIFRHSSLLKGMDKINFLTAFIHFDLMPTTIPVEYKTLFRLFSKLLADIMSPLVSDAFIITLLFRTIEAICLWEGMFPDAEQYLTTHQLVDMVANMRNLGPLRGWWAASGERIMSRLKRSCPEGGVNYLKIMYEKYIAFEKASRFYNTMNYMEKANGKGEFTEKTIKLTGTGNILRPYYWHGGETEATAHFVVNRFMDYLYTYVTSLEQDELIYHSSFYRVRRTYGFAKKVGKETFFEWILRMNILILQKEIEIDETLLDFKNDDHKELIKDIIQSPHPKFHVFDSYTVKDLAKFLPMIYKTAVVHGLPFSGRGEEYSEFQAASKHGYGKQVKDQLCLPHNRNNDLINSWQLRTQCSSWIAFINYHVHGNQVHHDKVYAQLNYCFRLHLPFDKLLHNMAFANVTRRNHKVHDHCPYIQMITTSLEAVNAADQQRNKEKIVIESNYDDSIHFTALNYILSTRIAVCGIDGTNKPILTNETVYTSSELCESSGLVSTKPSEIDRLYLIHLHPGRRNVQASAEEAQNKEGDICKANY